MVDVYAFVHFGLPNTYPDGVFLIQFKMYTNVKSFLYKLLAAGYND